VETKALVFALMRGSPGAEGVFLNQNLPISSASILRDFNAYFLGTLSVAAGLDLIDTGAVPKGVTVCNVFGHEPAIAEYVIMAMLTLTHRLFEAVTAFRSGSRVASPQFGGGSPHGEVLGRTMGIIG
jgi:lactate dehydrogenase-like 2-hydroxyacid dehydrogenase